jgi:hypothetical protein
MRRILIACLAVGSVLMAAPAAHADPHRCHRNTPRAFRPAELGRVVTVTEWTCVQKVSTQADGFAMYRAWVTTEWDHNFLGRPVQFERYAVSARLERGRRVIGRRICRLTRMMNRVLPQDHGKFECVTGMFRLRPNARYTADGQASFDVDRDGKRGGFWRFIGSPRV